MRDIYQRVTDTIVNAIEKDPGKFVLPWHKHGGVGLPQNALTQNGYRGINVICLWCVGMEFGYRMPIWATYLQWQELGCQVRKGEKAAQVVKYGTIDKEDEDTDEKRTYGYLKGYSVFNADQVDGYAYPHEPEMAPLARLEHIDAFVTATGAKIAEGGTRACYVPSEDKIYMPQAERFIDTKTQTRTEAFYSTVFHELTHWSGAPHRLARDKGGKFGSPEYAFEELVAELGAAFLCAHLQVTPEVREDHAQYLANWLKALKSDKKFIFSAATQAQLAADYLLQQSTPSA